MTSEQQSLMAVFNRIIDFMEEEGIRYYLLGGTAIGALRHHGFIPWDDDLDIMLDMENYEKLIEASDHLPWDDIEFICSEKDPLYYRPYARFSYKRDTMFMKSGMFNHGKCMGTMIDVMPMYDMPSSMTEEFTRDFLLYQEVLALPNTYKEAIYRYKDDYFALKEAEKTEGRINVVNRLRDKLKSYAGYDCDTKVVGLWEQGVFRLFDSSWFDGEPRYYPFEGRMLPVPSHVEATLRYQYGYDWYMIPESEGRITHKLYRDTEISANNYFADMDEFVDWEEADRLLDEKKHAQVDKLELLIGIESFKDEMLAHRVMMRCGLAPGDLERAAAELQYSVITERAADIIAKVRCFSGRLQEAGLTEGDVRAMIMALIVTGRYYDAVRVAKALGPDKDSYEVQLLEKTKTLAAASQDHDRKAVEEALQAFTDEEKITDPEVIRVCGEMLISDGAGHEEIDRHIGICRGYLEKYDCNSDIRKILADLLKADGRPEEAEPLYERVLQESRNGLDLLEIRAGRE